MRAGTNDPPRAFHDAALARFDRALQANLGTHAFPGNRVAPLRNGERIFPAMLEAIAEARETIEFLTYVYWTGGIARRFASAFSEAARRGVRVRVLLDGLGAAPMDAALLEEMEGAGVEIAWFRPPSHWKIWEIDNRTHRKVMVCDKRVGFTGGVGIADEWEGDARNPSEWRDTHFEIRGPAVLALEAAFLTNWLETEKPGIEDPDSLPELPHEGDTPLHVIQSGAAVGWSDMSSLMRTVIVSAKRRLRIQTAYFVPDDTAARLLAEAAGRGVEIQVMMPGPHSDSRLSQLAGQDCFEGLLEAGVELWSYQKTMLHAKVITIDGIACLIGSPNFNHRSMLKDDELCLAAMDPELTAVLDADFEKDLDDCEELDTGEWEKRGLLQRAGELVGKVVKPQV